jgi:phosphatidylinositol glycan class V
MGTLARAVPAVSGRKKVRKLTEIECQRRVVQAAILSRAIVLLVAVLAHFIGNDYDRSTDLLSESCDSISDRFIFQLVTPLVRWDAIWFLDIGMHGYRVEQQYAFLPGLPYLMRYIGRICIAL